MNGASNILYKYLDPCGIKALQTMMLHASDPASFNDPFEVRPAFDQERHDYFAKTHEAFHAQFGSKYSLLGNQSMVGMPTEDAVDFGEHLNLRFRRDLSRRFRVLCLSRDPANVLMWGHYTKSHQGLVIGIDTSVTRFPQGLYQGGQPINYLEDRSSTQLPVAYYKGTSVEKYDVFGNIVNNPNELVGIGSGLVIPFSEYHEQVEGVMKTALTTKARDWRYEEEVRFVYELPDHNNQLSKIDGRYFIQIPLDALREIIIGFRASANLAKGIVALFRENRIGNPKLFFGGCHPNRYEVQKHEAEPQYLIDYFTTVRPSLE